MLIKPIQMWAWKCEECFEANVMQTIKSDVSEESVIELCYRCGHLNKIKLPLEQQGKEMTLDELDRLAAEKVMGYAFDDKFHVWLTQDGKYVTNDWCPTRYIEQAWELLEKMGTKFRMLINYHEVNLPSYQVAIGGHEFSEKSAPLAITKACLKAVGEDV